MPKKSAKSTVKQSKDSNKKQNSKTKSKVKKSSEKAKKQKVKKSSTKSKTKQKEQKKLNFDISEHFLVPKHILLTEEEKEQLLQTLGVSESQLPKIRREDPAIKHLNAKPGDIIKIIRKSPIAGESIYYRSVR